MIPIRDARDRTIAFVGRDVGGDSQAKYLNTAGTEVYNKRSVLCGLKEAERPAREAGRLVVVEGCLDWLVPWGTGHKNIIATSGTAFTDEHAELLSRRFGNVPGLEIILCFDSDVSGQAATIKAGSKLLGRTGSYVAKLPIGDDGEKLDPAEIVNSGRDLGSYLDGRQSFFDFCLGHFAEDHKLDEYEGQVGLLRRVGKEIYPEVPLDERRIFAEAVANKTGISLGAVAGHFAQLEGSFEEEAEKKRGYSWGEAFLGGLLQFGPEARKGFSKELNNAYLFSDAESRAVALHLDRDREVYHTQGIPLFDGAFLESFVEKVGLRAFKEGINVDKEKLRAVGEKLNKIRRPRSTGLLREALIRLRLEKLAARGETLETFIFARKSAGVDPRHLLDTLEEGGGEGGYE